MPELPEVEITRRGLVPHLVGRRVEVAMLLWVVEEEVTNVTRWRI